MLPPIYYETCTDAVLAAYARLEDAILSAMVKRILRMGFVSEATKHQAEMLQEAGLLYEDILQLIAQRTDACTAQVRALFEDAGVTAVEIDNQVYRQAGIATVDIRQSDSLRQVLEAGFKKTMGVMDNLTKTTALTTQRAFYQACNDAYMQITSGAFSYQEAIRNVLKQAARGGLSVTYPSGHVDKLDVAARRAALTGVGQTAAEVSKTNAEDNGCYLMEITAHSGARPEHAKWQGQLVSLTGKDVGKIIDGLKVWSLRGIGYGSGDGFRGWNCRHDWYPYFPGLSTPNYTKKELEQLDEKRIEWNGKQYTEYEISQMQRARERNVRELKRQTLKMQKAAELTDKPELKEAATADYQATAAKLKAAEKDLQTFCNQTGQDRDRFREQVLGFSRSEAQKAVHAAKKSGLTSGGKDDIIREQERMRSSSDYAVPKDLVGSRKFRSKFDSMDSDKNVQRQYYQVAKSMLQHRSGTNGEDLYFYNTRTKKWYKSTTGTKPGTPDYTEEIRRGLKESKKGEIVSFHNHPLGMPPSDGDLNAMLKNGYKKGYTIGHNGVIFEYTAPKEFIPPSMYDAKRATYLKEGYSDFESQLNTLLDLKELFQFEFREVK